MGDNALNYNHLFHLIDDRRTFNDVGNPQNVLKTAVVMNLLMVIIVVSMCFVPIPFMAPIVIISYLITFTVLNIKYMRDFAIAVYQSDNLQIQKSKTKYDNDRTKISDLSIQVDKQLEQEYQNSNGTDAQLKSIYENIYGRAANSMSMFRMGTDAAAAANNITN